MFLVLDWVNCTSLNPIYVIGKFGFIEDQVEVLDSTFVILIIFSRYVTLDSLVLGVRPVGKLVETESKVSLCGVVLTDEPLVVKESLEAHLILLDVLIDLVESGSIIGEPELVGTYGSDGRSEGSENVRFHLCV